MFSLFFNKDLHKDHYTFETVSNFSNLNYGAAIYITLNELKQMLPRVLKGRKEYPPICLAAVILNL